MAHEQSLGGVVMVRMNLEQRAWYLDKFGMERACLVVRMSMFGAETILVHDLDGKVLEDVKPEDVYYVPQHAEEGDRE